jgi:hypothetical protein
MTRRDLVPALAGSSVVAGAALLAALAPVRLSIASVFLFAGPHNWMEARYCLARMPVRWGRLRPFFLTAVSGVLLLTLSFSAFPIDRALWHACLAGWVLALMNLVRRDLLGRALAIASLWMALAWRAPGLADLALVYLHPLAALWFLRRQIGRSYPEWLRTYRIVLATVPALAMAILVSARAADDPWLLQQAASSLIALPVAPALVALHAFLELLHYGVWVLMLPAIGLAGAPWSLSSIPLIRHQLGLPRLARGILISGAALVLILWIAFTLDYANTRRIYFAIAVIHVLAEVPFLLWLR